VKDWWLGMREVEIKMVCVLVYASVEVMKFKFTIWKMLNSYNWYVGFDRNASYVAKTATEAQVAKLAIIWGILQGNYLGWIYARNPLESFMEETIL